MDRQFGDHYFQSQERKSKRLCTKSTRKIGCKAHILIKEYCLYPEYEVNNANIKVNELRMLKKAKHQEIIQAFHEGVPIQKESRFYVSLPTIAAHNGVHLTGKAAGMTQLIGWWKLEGKPIQNVCYSWQLHIKTQFIAI